MVGVRSIYAYFYSYFITLGYETHSSVNDFPAIFSYFNCRGTENSLYNCSYSGLRYAFCTNRQTIKVTCEGIVLN